MSVGSQSFSVHLLEKLLASLEAFAKLNLVVWIGVEYGLRLLRYGVGFRSERLAG